MKTKKNPDKTKLVSSNDYNGIDCEADRSGVDRKNEQENNQGEGKQEIILPNRYKTKDIRQLANSFLISI